MPEEAPVIRATGRLTDGIRLARAQRTKPAAGWWNQMAALLAPFLAPSEPFVLDLFASSP